MAGCWVVSWVALSVVPRAVCWAVPRAVRSVESKADLTVENSAVRWADQKVA